MTVVIKVKGITEVVRLFRLPFRLVDNIKPNQLAGHLQANSYTVFPLCLCDSWDDRRLFSDECHAT
jgi:hypothetical protein